MARVSPATVSRVLNGTVGVSDEKAERVRAAVLELGAAPRKRPARNRGPEARRLIALLLIQPDGLHPVSTELFQTILHVERVLTESGASLLFRVVQTTADMPREVASGEVDGLLLAGRDLADETRVMLLNLPAVWLTSHHEGRGDVSLSGNEEIGRLAANHLLERGHRSLAYLQVPAGNPAHASRLEFFQFQATKAGARVHVLAARLGSPDGKDPVVWETINGEVRKQVSQLKAMADRPTGLFVPVGMLTGCVYRALAEEGLRPGRDIDVVCCEVNYPMIMGLNPRPAVISVNTATIARRAVMELFHRIEHGDEPPDDSVRLLIEPRLLPGEETRGKGHG